MRPIGASLDWSWHGYRTCLACGGRWKDDPKSRCPAARTGAGGMLIHAEDQARIGLLMARRAGYGANNRILPEGWIADSLRPCVALNPSYGLLWWWLNTNHGRYKSAPDEQFLRVGRGR